MTGLQQTPAWKVKMHRQQYTEKVLIVPVSSFTLLKPIYNLASTTYCKATFCRLYCIKRSIFFALKSLFGYHWFVMKKDKLFVLPFLYHSNYSNNFSGMSKYSLTIFTYLKSSSHKRSCPISSITFTPSFVEQFLFLRHLF